MQRARANRVQRLGQYTRTAAEFGSGAYRIARRAYQAWRTNARQARQAQQLANRSRSVGTPGNTNQTPSSLRNVKVTKREKAHFKPKKRVKISKSFKEKVEKSLRSKTHKGYYQENQLEGLRVGTLSNRQNVIRFPSVNQPFSGSLFNAARIIHVASRLWNGKAATLDHDLNLGGNFDIYSTKIDVYKQWWTFRARNNTERTLFVQVHKAQPKKNSADMGDPIQAWEDGLATQWTNGELISNAAEPGGGPALYPKKETLYLPPEQSTQFRKTYKNHTTKFVVAPGQTFEWNVNGPSKVYDFNKHYEKQDFYNFQKDDVWQMLVVHTDTTNFTGETGSVSHSRIATLGNSLIIEGTYHVSMACPDRTGMSDPSLTNLDNVKDVNCYDDFTLGPDIVAVPERVEVTNPQGDDIPE